MQEQKLFSIGDVARMFHLSVSSLRHYETLGLLQPERIDPVSNYRYYSVRQFEVLNTIRYLRALDMPLREIADFLQNRDIDRIEQKLRQQKQAVTAKIHDLQRISRKIDNRLQQLTDARSTVYDTVTLQTAKACRIIWMETSLKIQDFYDMEAPIRALEPALAEAVVFLGKVGVGILPENLSAGRFDRYDCIFLVLDDEDHVDGQTLTLPETECACIRFRGGHTEARHPYAQLMDYIRSHQLQVSGFAREITMIDYGLTNDTEKFVTEISIPVTRQPDAAAAPRT